ncbi:MAG: hypothetical protein LBM27_03230 [Lactobacillaceae bacterium]|nr:hypothetical protein [Lactobacillaceae bacterium]
MFITASLIWAFVAVSLGWSGVDQTWFLKRKLAGIGTLKFMLKRYENWSSRFVWEGVTYWFSNQPVLWLIGTIFAITLTLYSLAGILNLKNTFSKIVLSVFFLVFIPFTTYQSAGIYAMSTNYIWPFSLFAFGMLILVKKMTNKQVSLIARILGIISFALSMFSEVNVAVSLTFFALLIIYLLFFKNGREKLNLKNIWPNILLSISGLINVLVAPGNKERMIEEAGDGLKRFEHLSIFGKVDSSLVSINNEFLLNSQNWIIFFLTVSLFLLSFEKNRRNTNKLSTAYSGLLGFVIIAVTEPIAIMHTPIDISKELISKMDSLNYTFTNFSKPITLIPDLTLLLVLAMLVIHLFLAFEVKEAFYMIAILVLAGVSKVLVGFSISGVYGPRTSYFLYLGLIMIMIYTVDKLLTQKGGENESI